jgi:SAM-dependent methyltransferase
VQPTENTARRPEADRLIYPAQLAIAGHTVGYVPLFLSTQLNFNEYKWDEVALQVADREFQLPRDFADMPLPANFQSQVRRGVPRLAFAKCRFLRYRPDFSPRGSPRRLVIDIERTNYLDYLRSGEYLDHLIPGATQTYRDKYAPTVDETTSDQSSLNLTNICGVGIFLISADHKVIVSKHSPHVSVQPNVYSYSASGTMDWSNINETFRRDRWQEGDRNEFIHPFSQVTRECLEEIRHEPDPERLTLFGLGLDARNLYVQFSFFEWTSKSSHHIISTAPYAEDFHLELSKLEAIDLEPHTIASVIRERTWEPCAEAALLSLCAREYGVAAIERALDFDFVRRRWRNEMLAEWSRRAALADDLAVSSSRYPAKRILPESARYANAVASFAREAVTGVDVVEIGCGTGRVTEQLLGMAASYTVVDASADMIKRAKERLGERSRLVKFVNEFAQDYRGSHGIVIASLVLIHNVDDYEFKELARAMSDCADRMLLFEHVDAPRIPHPHTRLRSEEDLVAEFSDFVIARRDSYRLFEDEIAFLDLIRSAPGPAVESAEITMEAQTKKAAAARPVRLFYSYAHRDRRFRVQLEGHLSVMKRTNLVADWHDRLIVPGSDWVEEIDERLDKAEIILLLISADFLASDYCVGVEMQAALRRHSEGRSRVIPVIVRPCDWQSAGLAHLEVLPPNGRPIVSWKDRDEAFAQVALGIRRAVDRFKSDHGM